VRPAPTVASELAALDEQQARIVELVGGRTSPLVTAVN